MNDREPTTSETIRHAATERAQFATAETLARIEERVAANARELTEIRGWLVGSIDGEGKLTPGLLVNVASLQQAKGYILGLLATIAAAAITNAGLNILAHVYPAAK